MFLHKSKPTPTKRNTMQSQNKRNNEKILQHKNTKIKMFKKNHKLHKIQVNENHPAWKGDKVKYCALHQWVRKNKPKKEFCEHCKQKKKLEIANKGIYDRNFDNYLWLCSKCHRHYNLKKTKEQNNSNQDFLNEHKKNSKKYAKRHYKQHKEKIKEKRRKRYQNEKNNIRHKTKKNK